MKKRTSYTHEFYVLNRDLKSLICSDNRLGNIYKTIDILDKSCKYNIFFKITDDGYIREISFQGNGYDDDKSKFSLIFHVNNLGRLEKYLTYYLCEYEYDDVEDVYIRSKVISLEKYYINGVEF